MGLLCASTEENPSKYIYLYIVIVLINDDTKDGFKNQTTLHVCNLNIDQRQLTSALVVIYIHHSIINRELSSENQVKIFFHITGATRCMVQ